MGVTSAAGVAAAVRGALEARDPEALGALLDPDVRWGDDGHPRACRGRTDVLGVFALGMTQGATADVLECTGVEGPGGAVVVCGLRVRWPGEGEGAGRSRTLWHLYRLVDGRIAEIVVPGSRRAAREGARDLTGVSGPGAWPPTT